MDVLEELRRYQCESLFVLVGTNPVPNYVAAKLLAVPFGTTYLIHTVEVAPVKERLHERLTKDGFTCHPIEVHEADAMDIARKVENQAQSITGQRVGLNYTGGTKAMAVHAYRAIERALGGRPSPLIFTYLDARRLELWVDPHNLAASRSFPVGLAVQISLNDLCALHANPLKPDSTMLPRLPKTAMVLAESHAEVSFVKRWRQWCTEQLRKPDRPDKLKSKSQLNIVCLPEEVPLRQVTEAVRAEFPLTSSSVTLEETAQAAGVGVHHLAEWLDGKWLEHYTFGVLHRVSGQVRLPRGAGPGVCQSPPRTGPGVSGPQYHDLWAHGDGHLPG